MRCVVRAGCVLAVGFTGCYAIPPVENPVLVEPALGDVEQPVLVAPGVPTPVGYADVYDHVLDALDDYFDFIPGSRYSGEVRTLPRIAAGYEQPWKAGTPDPRERLLATFQSIRHYAVVRIQAGERGGYRVYVEVYKELEDRRPPPAAGRRSGRCRRWTAGSNWSRPSPPRDAPGSRPAAIVRSSRSSCGRSRRACAADRSAVIPKSQAPNPKEEWSSLGFGAWDLGIVNSVRPAAVSAASPRTWTPCRERSRRGCGRGAAR
jgi:hypothetical protein